MANADTTTKALELGIEIYHLMWVVIPLGIGFLAWLTASFRKLLCLTATVQQIKELVDKELRYNGSRSMKDVLDYLVAAQNRTDAWNAALLNQSTVAAWRADAQGNMDWINAALTHQLGYGLEGLHGNLWLSLICEEDRERVEQQWMRCVARQAPFTTTFTLAPGDANSSVVLMQAQPFFAPNKQSGALLGFAGTLQVTGDK